MSGHTPGPWEVDERCLSRVFAGGMQNRGICSTAGYQTNTVDPDALAAEAYANARLIAAAPNMAAQISSLQEANTRLERERDEAQEQTKRDAKQIRELHEQVSHLESEVLWRGRVK